MVPVLSSSQVRQADERTIAGGTPQEVLIERAAARCAERILATLSPDAPILVVAGMGNNGADGLAIARQLHALGRTVRALVVAHRPEGSAGFSSMLERFQERGAPLLHWTVGEAPPPLPAGEVLIDALLGSGLTRPIEGFLAEAIGWMNGSGRPVHAVDQPSGLLEGGVSGPSASVVRASCTYAFQFARPHLLLPSSAAYVGRLEVLPIGLDHRGVTDLSLREWIMEAEDVRSLLPVRPSTGHKGTFGHAVVIAGGPGGAGAALLAAQAALRSGVGLVTARVPAPLMPMLLAGAPEALLSVDPHPILTEVMDRNGRSIQGIAIGPGIGTEPSTARLLEELLRSGPPPLVIDADAINLLALSMGSLDMLPEGSILTPHPKEFDRLVGDGSALEAVRLDRARALAVAHGVVVVLKGSPTAVCSPDGQVHYSTTGNAGMAKGGSGDVLTGLLAGLRAQGLSPLAAALVGVHVHGAAGDRAAAARGQRGMTPSDLIERIPEAFAGLERNS